MTHQGLEGVLRQRLDALDAAGARLRARSPRDIAASVVQAWGLVRDPERELGRRARSRLPESTGLSLESVAFGLGAALSDARLDELLSLATRMNPPAHLRASPTRLSSLILAGNVFTACVEPWSVALICQSPVAVKASTRDDELPRLFQEALESVDPELAEASDVFAFPGGTVDLEATLLARSYLVSAFGSDRTLSSIRARLGPGTMFVPHGHGLGVGYVTRRALADEPTARRTAEAVALDVCAYDQRGCMSPHAVYVDEGAPVDASDFLVYVSDALRALATTMPRGALDKTAATAQLQWRGVAVARGELVEGDAWAVSYEGRSPFRVGPGHRNLALLDCDGPAALARAIHGLGVHLKVIGVAGDDADLDAVADALSPPLAPRVCRAGSMQLPRYGATADGRPVEHGFYRYVHVDR